MDSIGKVIIQPLLVVCYSLALLGCSCRAEKLSADQKAPQFANSSAGGSSLALPRDRSPSIGESSPLAKLLAGLHIKASEQTPADTSLLKSTSRSSGADSPNALERFHIKASGQTPADTSLLPRQQQSDTSLLSRQQQSDKSEPPNLQSRRAGQRGPAHVTLIGPEQNSVADSAIKNAGRQTPANVGLLKPTGGGAPSRPAPAGAAQEDGVQRQEMTSFKEVNGESVRVVVGNYGYESPEGLPVSFKYMSDENGNQASFSIGTPGAGGGGSGGRGSGGAGGGSRGTGDGSRGTGGGAGKTGGAAGGGGGGQKYLPPK